jgi:dolichyl-phosphate-mannose--protein O-mannosyl transferase
MWQGIKDLAGKFRIEHFLLLYFAVHMLQIAFPSDGSMIFDEAHYVPASVATLNGIAANAEHPPLPKIIGAISIAIFGNNWFAWRFPSVLMEIAALYLIYLIAKRFLGNPWALGGTMLLGLDTVFFIHGGTLLIDMPMFLFGYLAVELYFRKHYGWSAVSMGLAFFSREMSIFLFAALGIYHLYAHRKSLKPITKSIPLRIAVKYTLVAFLVMFILFTAYDLRFQPASAVSVSSNVNANIVLNATGQPLTTIYSTSLSTSKSLILWAPQHLNFIYGYHGPGGIVINEAYAPFQYAWNWILPFDPKPQNGTFQQPDPFSAPTYFRVDVDVTVNGVATHYIPIWYHAQANLALWYGFWPALVGLGYAIFRWKPKDETTASTEKPKERRRTDSDVGKDTRATAIFIFSGMILNYVPWLALSLLVRRIGFNYYMIYTLPFVAMGVAFTWKLLPKGLGKPVLALNVLLALAFFLYYFPVHPMP